MAEEGRYGFSEQLGVKEEGPEAGKFTVGGDGYWISLRK